MSSITIWKNKTIRLKSSSGIEIELMFQEDSPSEWSDELIRDLDEIIQIDLENRLNLINLRVSSVYDPQQKAMVNKAEFLNINHQPLAGSGSRSFNNRKFSEYLRLFYLASLRDPENEFSTRSQFWGQIIKDLRVDQAQQDKLIKSLKKVNDDILNADPRLGDVVKTLDNAQNIMNLGSNQSTSVQALPLTPWELLSRAEVVIQNSSGKVKFPIQNHGQGIQSLAVLFLFEAYVQVFLKPNFTPDTEAILALEEPEAHLHPQAIRTLSKHLNQIQSQKLISTHSPYFVQEIPLTQLRLFKRGEKGTKAFFINKSFSEEIVGSPELERFCNTHSPKYFYSPTKQKLTLRGKMTEDERRDLLPMFNAQQDFSIEN